MNLTIKNTTFAKNHQNQTTHENTFNYQLLIKQ